MLQTIRENSQSIVAKVIVGLIAVTFALFGVESLVSLTGGSNAPATVNGEEISERQLVQGVELQRRQLLNQMGENADPTLIDDNLISQMVLDSLVEQTVLTQTANNQDLIISDRMIDQLLVNTPDFQVDGQFDRAQFESVLRNAGFTPLTYRELLRKEKLIEQLRTGYLLSAFAIDAELEQVVSLDRQTRDMSYFVLDAKQVEAAIQIDDEQARAYFDERRGQFKTDESVVIEYLLLDKAIMLDEVDVSTEDAQAKYDALVANFEGQEERKAAHILIEISDERDAAAAEAKAAELFERIKAGESFEALAQAESDDPGSSESGGDLGFNGKGLFVPEFEDALFAMVKGEISEPVRTEYGFHIIRLDDIKTAEAPAFQEVAEDLKFEVAREKVEALYVERLNRLADISFSAGDLVEPAEALGLKIQTSAPFSRVGGDDDITSHAKVVKAAFGQEQLKEGVNSVPLELDASRAVVLRVKQHLQPREQTFEEVADSVKAQLMEERVAEALDAQVAEITTALQSGKSLQDLAAGAEVVSVEAVNRAQRELPIEIREELFRLPAPQGEAASYAAVALGDGSRAIVALTGVAKGSAADLTDQERTAMRAVLGSRSGQYDYQDLVSELNSKAEVERL